MSFQPYCRVVIPTALRSPNRFFRVTAGLAVETTRHRHRHRHHRRAGDLLEIKSMASSSHVWTFFVSKHVSGVKLESQRSTVQVTDM